MTSQVHERINGRIGGCWDWSSVPELVTEKFFTQSSPGAQRTQSRKRRRARLENKKNGPPRKAAPTKAKRYTSELGSGEKYELD